MEDLKNAKAIMEIISIEANKRETIINAYSDAFEKLDAILYNLKSQLAELR